MKAETTLRVAPSLVGVALAASLSRPALGQTTPEQAPPDPSPRYHVEVGALGGVVSRPAAEDRIHYAPGPTWGGFGRVDVFPWLAARVLARFEASTATLEDGALGAAGLRFDDASLRRTYLAVSIEPTWSPVPRLDVWAGVGLGWGRTRAPALHATNADNVVIASHAAVFEDFPLSLGARFEIVPNWVTLGAAASLAPVAGQSGRLLGGTTIPDQNGKLMNLTGFPEIGLSWSVLAMAGVLL